MNEEQKFLTLKNIKISLLNTLVFFFFCSFFYFNYYLNKTVKNLTLQLENTNKNIAEQNKKIKLLIEQNDLLMESLNKKDLLIQKYVETLEKLNHDLISTKNQNFLNVINPDVLKTQNDIAKIFFYAAGSTVLIVVSVIFVVKIANSFPGININMKSILPENVYKFLQEKVPFFNSYLKETKTFIFEDGFNNIYWKTDIINQKSIEMYAKFITQQDFINISSFMRYFTIKPEFTSLIEKTFADNLKVINTIEQIAQKYNYTSPLSPEQILIIASHLNHELSILSNMI